MAYVRYLLKQRIKVYLKCIPARSIVLLTTS